MLKLFLEKLSLEDAINSKGEDIGEPFRQRFVLVGVDELLSRANLDNYREHTFSGAKRLSESIETKGLLEPIILSVDSGAGSIDLVDGEGRFWSSYRLGAKYIPCVIFYDIGEQNRIRMKAAANAMKKSIAPEDLSFFASGLKGLLQEYKNKQSEEFYRIVGRRKRRYKEVKIIDVAEAMNRNRKTVSNYLLFARLPKQILNYVKEHPEGNDFSRLVKIGRRIKEDDERIEFFYDVVNHENKRGRMSSIRFNNILKNSVSRPRGVLLVVQNGNHNQSKLTTRELTNTIGQSGRYVSALGDFFIYNDEIREVVGKTNFETLNGESVDIKSFVNSLLRSWDDLSSNLGDRIREEVDVYINKPTKLRFDEEILLELQRRRREGFEPNAEIIYPLDDKIGLIPLDELVIGKNIRTRIDEESIDALARELKDVGQLKPGLVVENDGYKVVYGQRRVLALRRIGHKYFKAFVKEGLSDVEIALLQGHEDLCEQDKPAERARVLYLHYKLMKDQAELEGRAYNKRDFVREFIHLASKKSLLNALKFMELDDLTKNFSALNLISYGAAIEIGRLEKDKRVEVLYSALASPRTKDIKRLVNDKIAEKDQLMLFGDMPRSYDAIFREFGMQARAPFLSFDYYLNSVSDNKKLFLEFAKYIQRLEKLKNTLGLYS